MNIQTEYKKLIGTRLFVLLTVCMIVVAMAVPVFAADYPNDFPGLPSFPSGFPTYIVRYGYNVWAETECYMVQFFNSEDPIYYNGSVLVRKNASMYSTFYFKDDVWNSVGAVSAANASFGSSIFDANFIIYDKNGDVWWDSISPDLGEKVTEVLPTVLNWIQQTLNALFLEGGALSGLLLLVAVPVAITLLFLAARFIRSCIWGA